MKRLWIGLGIMVVVAGLLVWGNVTITNACKQMSEEIKQVIDAVELHDSYEEASSAASALKRTWETYHTPLSAIKNHEELHDLMLDINLIEKYATEQEQEELLEACNDSLVRLEHIKDGEKVSFGNVF